MNDVCGPPVGDAGQNPIAAPRPQPARSAVMQSPRLEINRPRPMFPLIANDPPQQTAPIGARGLNQQCDVLVRHEIGAFPGPHCRKSIPQCLKNGLLAAAEPEYFPQGSESD